MRPRFLSSLLVGVAVFVFIVEEWLWEGLKRVMRQLGRLPVVRQIESGIARLPPAGAAVVFVLPTLLALPVKLFALKLLATGAVVRGALLILGAKVLATALFARIFVLTRPALMKVAWFRRLYFTLVRWRQWVHAQISAVPAWRAARERVLHWRAVIETALGRRNGRWTRRWAAARRLERMRRAQSAA